MKNVPLGLITIFNPRDRSGLNMQSDQLPTPQQRDRNKVNAKLTAQAQQLGVTPVVRGKVVDNGIQPFEHLRGKYVSPKRVATIIADGRFFGIYVNVSGQCKLELRLGTPLPDTPGVLSREQMATLVAILKDEISYFQVSGLWVNPGESGLSANLLLKATQHADSPFVPLPIKVVDDYVYSVILPD